MSTPPVDENHPIKLVDLNRQHESLRADLLAAFETVLDRGRFILGEEVAKLERDFGALHQCRHAVGISNGTDALTLALKALDVGPGDEVILPAMTFCATAEAVCNIGATPVLVDVEEQGLGIDPLAVEDAVSDATRAIIPVHLHGLPVPLEPLFRIATKHGLVIVEDSAQAHGASEDGHPVGSRTSVGSFSCFPAKNLGALGDAGIITTQNEALADRIRALANHGRREKHANSELGFNNRLDELQAALLNVKLPHLMTWNEKRRSLARRYSTLLQGTPLTLPCLGNERRISAHHLYVVRCSDRCERDRLAAHLRGQGIETGMHYPTPLHLQPALAYLGGARGKFPVSERAAETMLSLPIFAELRDDEQDRVVDSIVRFFGSTSTAPSAGQRDELVSI